jgi:TRAP-type uncharacterized transport system substrate-binding protein
MMNLYGKGFNEIERTMYCSSIISNIASSIQVLCAEAPSYAPSILDDEKFNDLKGEIMEIKLNEGFLLEENIAKDIAYLWKHEAIQTTFENRAKFQLVDAAAYFLDKVETVAKAGKS